MALPSPLQKAGAGYAQASYSVKMDGNYNSKRIGVDNFFRTYITPMDIRVKVIIR